MITDKIDNVTKIHKEYMNKYLPAPISVKIEMTARCNLKCWFCATKDSLRTKGDMDFDLYTKIVDDILNVGVKEIGLFYLGESFLYNKLPEAIKYAKDAGCNYVFITTNGSCIKRDKLKKCFEAGLDSLKFSFNWLDKEQCKQMSGVDCFDKIIETIKTSRELVDKYNFKCSLYASSIRYNDEQNERMKETIKLIEPYIDEHYWLPLYNQAGFIDDRTCNAGNVGRYDNQRSSIPCWQVFTEGHITFDGKLTACGFDHNGDFEMGDLTKISFMDAWNSDKFQDLRDHHLNKQLKGTVCEECFV
jgi:MoaA/NifB/PqqE/SkfB family radical SAM enzyme